MVRKLSRKIYMRIWGRLAATGAADKRREKLKKLYPGETAEKLLENYYTDLLAALLKIGMAGILTAAAVLIFCRGAAEDVTWVRRNPFGEGSRYAALSMRRQDGSRQEVQLEIRERLYTEETLQGLYLEAKDILEKRMQGKNESMTAITGPMDLPDRISGYPFEISWRSSRPEIISADGTLQQGIYGREEEVELTAAFQCEGFEESSTWKIKVCFPEATAREQWEEALRGTLQESDARSAYEERWELPREIAGERISWEEKEEHPAAAVLGLTCGCMLLVFRGRSRKVERKLRERDAALEEEYCNVVTKLALYLGAGMTVPGAWKRTAASGGAGDGRGYVYEEMRLSCRELDSGIYESECYEAFGRRCGRQEYIRLSALLSQNLKTGNRELIGRMREEALRAQENQKYVARRRGEEASTRLLVPMVMMLGMVLTMIMIPAFGNIG
ncbi:MAG: hypothetical protein HDR26_03465 [Lachnospiraceae bacterium]|nr:hypothetical protein [Lachnospiraceae bacterium]